MPFQKSWFVDKGREALYRSNLRFFTQKNEEYPLPKVFYQGPEKALFNEVCNQEERQACTVASENTLFAMIDLLGQFSTLDEYLLAKDELVKTCLDVYENLVHRKFLCIHIENLYTPSFEPIAWDLAKTLSSHFSLKDEKIGCFKSGDALEGDRIYYSLYFRKDEKSPEGLVKANSPFLGSGVEMRTLEVGAWQVIRPPRRKKDEILHPAKYPEQLVEQFIKTFTEKGEAVFDPMSGTGSTQVAALNHGRNAYGCELSAFFHEIALKRCEEARAGQALDFNIALKDAKEAVGAGFPSIDYVITSPPYWDMLNMKGAEYQARRKEKGLQLNYSDDKNDLGNISDYQLFVDLLLEVYLSMQKLLKSGAHVTIIVKNIKKKGSNYPFAWDLSEALCKHGWKLLPEFFWCQDDINLAPYGYGNTWVSNTFHQYCLTFRVP